MFRKLLTMRRKLVLKMKDFLTSSKRKSGSNFDINALNFAYIFRKITINFVRALIV